MYNGFQTLCRRDAQEKEVCYLVSKPDHAADQAGFVVKDFIVYLSSCTPQLHSTTRQRCIAGSFSDFQILMVGRQRQGGRHESSSQIAFIVRKQAEDIQ